MIQALNFGLFLDHSDLRSYLLITYWGFNATALFWAVLAGSVGGGRGIQHVSLAMHSGVAAAGMS